MTSVDVHGAPTGRWEDARGVAVACVGALLLAGTALSGISQWDPTPPKAKAAPPSSRNHEGLAVGPGSPTAGPAPAQTHAEESDEWRNPASPHVLDVNRADLRTLQTLPGVGPVLARRIVGHREVYGPFRTPEELLRVSGIGSKRYARLHGLIRTGESP
jgi:competence protein ComEA